MVAGSTNVNKFGCVITNYYTPDTLMLYKGNDSEEIKVTGCLKLDVKNFDCQHPIMTADLRKTLKANEYPRLIIRFISLSRYPDHNTRTTGIKGMVSIELAGIIKRFEVNYSIIPNGIDAFIIAGNRKVNFSDFNIIPPRKIGGIIQTNNALEIVFKLKVRVLD